MININLPIKPEHIRKRLSDLNIKSLGKKKIEALVNNFGSDIWKINEKNNDIINIIDVMPCDQLIDYVNKKYQQYDSKVLQLLDYLIDKYEITLNRAEIKKIDKTIFFQELKFPINDEILEDLIINLTNCLNKNKIYDMCKKININNERILTKINIMLEINKHLEFKHSCISKKSLDKKIGNHPLFNELIEELKITKIIEEYHKYIYDAQNYFYEDNISNQLKVFRDNNESDYDNKFTIDFIKEDINEFTKSITLNEEQLHALFNIFNNKISIITGGPGYGKTTIIKTLLDICELKDLKVTILAPTGKVISKIKKDLVDKENIYKIFTIHKFLFIKDKSKYLEDSENDDEINSDYNNIKNSKFIVIDEMSMMSNKLFSDFLNYLNANDISANLVFIGDRDQLPSIEIGNILSELIKSNCFTTTILIKPMRQEQTSQLLKSITYIKTEKNPPINNTQYKYIKTNNKQDCKEKVMNEINNILNSTKTFEMLSIITPSNNNIKEYSEDIRKCVLTKTNNKYIEKEYCIGDYIIITKNIYKYQYNTKFILNEKNVITRLIICNEDIFNGMIGKITKIERIDNNDYYVVNFYDINLDGKFEKKFFNENKINKYSYINTVHKFQGSENHDIIIILTDCDNALINFNLLYTAITRAKKNCYIFGEEKIYLKAFEQFCNRISGLKYKLRENLLNNKCNGIDISGINFNVINNNKKGIVTLGYNNILYRSRIEAKWSYFLNKLNFNICYEPFDLFGYIPDFIINSDNGNINNLLVEIKSDLDETNYEDYYKKAINAGWDSALLILGYKFKNIEDNDKFKNCISIGKLMFQRKNKNKGKIIRSVDFIIYKNCENEYDYAYIYTKNKEESKIYNKIDQYYMFKNPIEIDNRMTKEDNILLNSLWSSISNETQYKR
jgi:exodeoxyribonuclease V alpha subunit